MCAGRPAMAPPGRKRERTNPRNQPNKAHQQLREQRRLNGVMTGVKLPVGFSFCRETQQMLKVPKSGSSAGRWLTD